MDLHAPKRVGQLAKISCLAQNQKRNHKMLKFIKFKRNCLSRESGQLAKSINLKGNTSNKTSLDRYTADNKPKLLTLTKLFCFSNHSNPNKILRSKKKELIRRLKWFLVDFNKLRKFYKQNPVTMMASHYALVPIYLPETTQVTKQRLRKKNVAVRAHALANKSKVTRGR